MKVGILTIEQKEQLVDKEYNTDSFFGPIQDINNNWILSIEEMNLCVNPDFIWVKELPLIEYVAKNNSLPEDEMVVYKLTPEQSELLINSDFIFIPEMYVEQLVVLIPISYEIEEPFLWLLDCPTLDYNVYLYIKK